MTYLIYYMDKQGKVDKTLLDLYEQPTLREYLKIEKVLFIGDVPETAESIRSINLAIYNIEKLLCQHLGMKISRK